MTVLRRRAKGVVAAQELQVAVRSIIAVDGELRVSQRLRLSPSTIARIGAGLPVNRASLDVAIHRLGLEGSHAAAEPVPAAALALARPERERSFDLEVGGLETRRI